MTIHRTKRRGCILTILVVMLLLSMWGSQRSYEYYPLSGGSEIMYTPDPQCGGGSYSPVGGSVIYPMQRSLPFYAHDYYWKPNETYVALYAGGRVIGGYYTAGPHAGKYLRYRQECDVNGVCRDVWDDFHSEPPHPLPEMYRVEQGSGGSALFGLDTERLQESRTRYRINGKEVSRDQVVQAVQGADLPDVKRRLVVIGPDHLRKQAVEDLQGRYGELVRMAGFTVEDFAPDAWQVKGVGFRTDGSPTIYGLEQDGKVIFRQDDMLNLEANLRAAVLRKPSPDYNPSRDPDYRFGGDAAGMILVLVCALILGLLVATPNKKVEVEE